GQRTVKTKTYDANMTEEAPPDEPEKVYHTVTTGTAEEAEPELDSEYLDTMIAAEDPDALVVQGFEEELEGFFQETPDLQEALVSYLEARQKLLSKKRSRGFWPVSANKGGFKGSKGSKGRGKSGKGGRDQLLARIARSHCRICGAKGHWKAECPQKGKASASAEATTTVAEVLTGDTYTVAADQSEVDEVLTQIPAAAMDLAEAHILWEPIDKQAEAAWGSIHAPAQALFSTTATDAILDTGASRCVMGKSLLQGFLNQLSETVRNQVKIMKSAVRSFLLSTVSRSLPTMAPKHSTVASSPPETKGLSLSVRFSRLQDPTSTLTQEQVETMPLEQLGQCKIMFGKAMKGRLFVDAVQHETDWVRWMLDHMSSSTKAEHVAFLTYVRRHVEEAEKVESDLVRPEGATASEALGAKAVPKSRSQPRPEAEVWDLIQEDESLGSHGPDPILQEQVTMLGERLSQMEGMMQQLIHHLRDTAQAHLDESELSKMQRISNFVPRSSNGRWHIIDIPSIKLCRENLANWEETKPDGQMEYVWLSRELRSAVESTQKRNPNANPIADSSAPADATSTAPRAESDLEGWAPPPTIHKNLGLSIKTFVTAAAWQRGRIERHGDIVKDMLTSFKLKMPWYVTKDLSSHAMALGNELEAEKHRLTIRKPFGEQSSVGALQLVEGQSIVWIAHGTTILRCAPENLRPASLREWQHLSTSAREEAPSRVGILGVHVDDGVCGGDEYFHQKIDALQKVLPFGSRKHQSFVFTGIQLEQFPDFSIRASQSEYVHKIPHIDVGRHRRQSPDVAVNEDERTKLRGLIGSLQYAVTHTRPDIAARLGELQSQTTSATVQTLLAANKVLREAQEYHQVCIFFRAIPVEQLTFVAFGDASFASSKNLNSHQGVLICATDDRLDQNLEAPLSPLTWSSKKIPRVVRSTLSAEAYAMSKAVDLLGRLL
ncbi:unnamed protein product, partial [Symbiodinium sp. CCMP2456]